MNLNCDLASEYWAGLNCSLVALYSCFSARGVTECAFTSDAPTKLATS
jgi:hypothetical protein